MHINIQAIYPATYLNLLSPIMKELNLHGLIDQLVPMDAQCKIPNKITNATTIN